MDTYTLVHVVISLVGILTGFVVVAGMVSGQLQESWTSAFIGSTVATSATGFGFPFDHLLPSHIVGIISLIVLAVAILARYAFRLAGVWRTTYVVTAVTALYLNVFVLVVQLFRRVPALNALAPTQSEPPFEVAQFIVLVIFVFLGIRAVQGFRQARAIRATPA